VTLWEATSYADVPYKVTQKRVVMPSTNIRKRHWSKLRHVICNKTNFSADLTTPHRLTAADVFFPGKKYVVDISRLHRPCAVEC